MAKIDSKAVIRWIKYHIWGPTGSAILHVLVFLALLRLVTYKAMEKAPEIETQIIEPDEAKLEDFKKELEKIEQPDIVDQVTPPEVDMSVDQPPDVDNFSSPEPTVDYAALEVQAVQSPLIMRGLLAGRSDAGRAAALKNYGGRWGELTERAVIKALEWLKNNQNKTEGSWGPDKVGMTALGLLTFLAHGETTSSAKYGETVELAIKYLVSRQDDAGRFFPVEGTIPATSENPNLGGKRLEFQRAPYSHGMATYAISEAYGLTQIPMLKPVMDKAAKVIVDGQMANGGWDYYYRKSNRADLSAASWQLQALKAALMAGSETPGIHDAIEKAVAFIKKEQIPETGAFNYTLWDNEKRGGHTSDSLTGIAVLCMQLTGHGLDREARAGVNALNGTGCDWQDAPPWSMYAWYYITQSKFHAGPQTWEGWNNKFAPQYVRSQNPDGSWNSPSGRHQQGKETNYGQVYSTTFAALALQVYYRLLPTYQKVEAAAPTETKEDDVVVEIL